MSPIRRWIAAAVLLGAAALMVMAKPLHGLHFAAHETQMTAKAVRATSYAGRIGASFRSFAEYVARAQFRTVDGN